MNMALHNSLRCVNYVNRFFRVCNVQYTQRFLYTTEQTLGEENSEKPSSGGFAKAFEKYTKNVDEGEVVKEESFATLFKKSKFIDLGDPEGKLVTGTIFHVVKDDLYIDFGWKFYCVCPRPQKNGRDYVRGSKVRLSIKDLELSSRFLGSERDLTILEADAVLVGLISSPLTERTSYSPPKS